MAASFRNVDEIRELAGCDEITISPMHLQELRSCTSPLLQKLSPSMGGCTDELLGRISHAEFQEMHNSDQMATELLDTGVRKFAADQRTIEEMLAQVYA